MMGGVVSFVVVCGEFLLVCESIYGDARMCDEFSGEMIRGEDCSGVCLCH